MSRTPTTKQPLTTFEADLLAELREEVSSRNPQAVSAARPARRWVLPSAAAAGLAALAGALVLSTPAPAFAIEVTEDGDVTVIIHRPESPAEVETALAEHGIEAVVDFTPTGTICAPGRFIPAPAPTNDAGADAEIEVDGRNSASPIRITMDPQAFTGFTIVIESAWVDGNVQDVATGITTGEVGQCDLVPTTQTGSQPDAVPTR